MTAYRCTDRRRSFTSALFLSVCVMLLTLFTLPAAAQQCDPGACSSITIYNCTNQNFAVSFFLCCNGNVFQTNWKPAPAVPCPNPSATYNFSPCTIIGLAGFNPPLPANVTYQWDPANCRMRIRYQ